ncbi:MAG TPA: hypothetical protein EYG75_03690 [Campylobacterales bacterium]|nr:hypothetical protein [Campylobacterales bacterium]
MRYLITLTPLEPYLFGGDNTFGKIGDKSEGTYLVNSRAFPQQSAVLGMLRREMMTQAGFLTRKVRGEWVDRKNANSAKELVGDEKFDILSDRVQNFGTINELGAIFLLKDKKRYIKKADIDSYLYEDGFLKGFHPKKDIFDNYVEIDSNEKLTSSDIFTAIEQVGNKKDGEENSLFKRRVYKLKRGFAFGCYLDVDFALENAIVSLGADGTKFRMSVQKSDDTLNYQDKNGYLVLLSDALITIDTKEQCEFAITKEISYRNLQSKRHVTRYNQFRKSQKVYLYEKGSLFINPTEQLIENLNNKNCQKIGYNRHTGEE